MSNDPAFLFYTKDFFSGISDLTMEERGQYITLLCLQHQKGHLTDKLIKLSVGNAAADVMAKFVQDEKGLWYNKRLEKEIEKRKEHSEKQRQRALNGWKKRKDQGEATADATALPLVNVNANGSVNKNSTVIIPLYEEFYNYAQELLNKLDLTVSDDAIRLKYESWKDNNWHTGGKNPREIKNWKNTLANTLRFLKDEKNGTTKSTWADSAADYING